MRTTGLVTIAVLTATLVYSESTVADMAMTDTEGWHTWRTNEPDAVTEMCCFTWQRGEPAESVCNLDGRHVSYGHRRDCSVAAGPVQFYVRIENGRPAAIRTLSAACPVTAESAVRDHGVLPAKDNIEWFRHLIEDPELDRDIRQEALFALVQSESDAAFEYLDRLLSRR